MKVLYLTLESYQNQAIIKSQVINLFKAIQREQKSDDLSFILTTFDHIDKDEEEVRHEDVPGLQHIMYKHRGTVRNVLCLVRKALSGFRKVDIVHVRSYLPMIPALLLKLFSGKKVIFDMRGLLPEETLLRKSNKLQYWLLRRLEKISCRYADRIVVVSNSFREIMIKRWKVSPGKLMVIPTFSAGSINGAKQSVNVPDLRKEEFAPEDILFVYSGAFEKWQCAEEVISFFKVLRSNIHNAGFVILTPHVEEFTSFTQRHFEGGHCYIRHARNEDLYYYLKQCNYGLLFRKPHIINEVAAPIKFKDYLSAGLPVLATNGIGDYSQYIRDYQLGIIVEGLTEPDFKAAATAIRDGAWQFDPQAIKQTANELFDVKYAVKAYMNLYYDLKA